MGYSVSAFDKKTGLPVDPSTFMPQAGMGQASGSSGGGEGGSGLPLPAFQGQGATGGSATTEQGQPRPPGWKGASPPTVQDLMERLRSGASPLPNDVQNNRIESAARTRGNPAALAAVSGVRQEDAYNEGVSNRRSLEALRGTSSFSTTTSGLADVGDLVFDEDPGMDLSMLWQDTVLPGLAGIDRRNELDSFIEEMKITLSPDKVHEAYDNIKSEPGLLEEFAQGILQRKRSLAEAEFELASMGQDRVDHEAMFKDVTGKVLEDLTLEEALEASRDGLDGLRTEQIELRAKEVKAAEDAFAEANPERSALASDNGGGVMGTRIAGVMILEREGKLNSDTGYAVANYSAFETTDDYISWHGVDSRFRPFASAGERDTPSFRYMTLPEALARAEAGERMSIISEGELPPTVRSVREVRAAFAEDIAARSKAEGGDFEALGTEGMAVAIEGILASVVREMNYDSGSDEDAVNVWTELVRTFNNESYQKFGILVEANPTQALNWSE